MVVPAVLCIDVEQDEHVPVLGARPWTGFAETVALIERLRGPLAERSGVEPHPTWFVRMDPMVERCFGRIDFAVVNHRDLVEGLIARGDHLGLHVHAHRWDEAASVPFSAYGDLAWARQCVAAGADAFERCFGERPLRSRQGGYFLPEEVVDATVDAGIAVDLTPEPGLVSKQHDLSFGDRATAPSTDFTAFPRRPYRPSRRDAARPARDAADARPLVFVPLTAFDHRTALAPVHRRIARRVLRRARAEPLSPWKRWPDAQTYWDLANRAIDDGPVPYLAIAVRTDAPDSASARRVRDILELLPEHPISRRLAFVDPLTLHSQ